MFRPVLRAFLALASLTGLALPVPTLDGKQWSFPQDATAARAVIVVTFTKAAQAHVFVLEGRSRIVWRAQGALPAP